VTTNKCSSLPNFTSIARSNGALLRSNGHSLSLRTDRLASVSGSEPWLRSRYLIVTAAFSSMSCEGVSSMLRIRVLRISCRTQRHRWRAATCWPQAGRLFAAPSEGYRAGCPLELVEEPKAPLGERNWNGAGLHFDNSSRSCFRFGCVGSDGLFGGSAHEKTHINPFCCSLTEVIGTGLMKAGVLATDPADSRRSFPAIHKPGAKSKESYASGVSDR